MCSVGAGVGDTVGLGVATMEAVSTACRRNKPHFFEVVV
jgi:hypothetical protein